MILNACCAYRCVMGSGERWDNDCGRVTIVNVHSRQGRRVNGLEWRIAVRVWNRDDVAEFSHRLSLFGFQPEGTSERLHFHFLHPLIITSRVFRRRPDSRSFSRVFDALAMRHRIITWYHMLRSCPQLALRRHYSCTPPSGRCTL